MSTSLLRNYLLLFPRLVAQSPWYAVAFLLIGSAKIAFWICGVFMLWHSFQADWGGFSLAALAGMSCLGLIGFFDGATITIISRHWGSTDYIHKTRFRWTLIHPIEFRNFKEPLEIRTLKIITGISDSREANASLEKHFSSIGGRPALPTTQQFDSVFKWSVLIAVTLVTLRILASPLFPIKSVEIAFALPLAALTFFGPTALLNLISGRIARVALITILETDPSPLPVKMERLGELGFDLRVPTEQNRGIA